MRVVLDAGHGYETPGKRTSDGFMREWEFNSDVAIHVRNILAAYDNVEVKFVHDTTRLADVSLTHRVSQANSWKADVYVSIHANAHGDGKTWTSAKGIETFVHTSKPAKAVQLAQKVQRKLIEKTGRVDRGVKFAKFQVLEDTHMTAILCECGFMTNQEEAELLKTDDYRRKCAWAIAEGLVEQYGLQLRATKQHVPYPGTLIRKGSRGENVKKVQTIVGAAADGIFGVKTEAAVKQYQKANGLKSDGLVGALTWNKMYN